jgi:hypothetical protein
MSAIAIFSDPSVPYFVSEGSLFHIAFIKIIENPLQTIKELGTIVDF